MSVFNGMNITATALTAQRLRMDVISSNLANAQTTRGTLVNGEWRPYTRKTVVFQEQKNSNTFASHLKKAKSNTMTVAGAGVRVTRIEEDDDPYKLVYDPTHPDANEAGYVEMPNVDLLKETVDYMSATRAYEANITALNATESILMETMEIGE